MKSLSVPVAPDRLVLVNVTSRTHHTRLAGTLRVGDSTVSVTVFGTPVAVAQSTGVGIGVGVAGSGVGDGRHPRGAPTASHVGRGVLVGGGVGGTVGPGVKTGVVTRTEGNAADPLGPGVPTKAVGGASDPDPGGGVMTPTGPAVDYQRTPAPARLGRQE